MFKTILVPTDGSAIAEKAAAAAVELARQNGGLIVAISVADPYPFGPLSETALAPGVPAVSLYEEQTRKYAELNVRRVADMAARQKVSCQTEVAVSFSPYEEIIHAAEKHHCDAIFMGSHGRRGLSRLFVGSETQKVLAHAKVPVTVFR